LSQQTHVSCATRLNHYPACSLTRRICTEPGAIRASKNELIRAAIYLLGQDSLRAAISISLNDDPNENLLRICDVCLRQRDWSRTGRFANAADGVCVSSYDDHAVGY